MTTLTLTPGAVTLDHLAQIYWSEAAVRLDPACHPDIERAHARIARAVAGTDAVYGVNTGFGKLASVKIASEDTAALQRNLILSHCCGVGPAIPRRIARLLMALKLLSLGRGASGVRLELIALIEAMLDKGVTPVIPAQGSVGASGDLAPLAHMAAVMMGHGEAEFGGTVMAGDKALETAGLSPIHGNNALWGNTNNYSGAAVDGNAYVKADCMLDMATGAPEPKAGSPCRGAADATKAPASDFWNAPRGGAADIGAVDGL